MTDGYEIRDLRGASRPTGDKCRVCGSDEHFQDYNQPSMECVAYLRSLIPATPSKSHHGPDVTCPACDPA